jgi:tartrate dehydratase beta subunit/fumarate hydratase class I family protein
MRSIPYKEKMESAFDNLRPEAVRRFEVENSPVIVNNDPKGNDLYIENVKKYKRD